MKYSANLGFLWTELPLDQAVRRAAKNGFEAVEFHWPYETPLTDLKKALAETGLPVMGLNTVRGRAGENGLAALPGRVREARTAIDQGLAWADDIGAANLHVMAGFASGAEARDTLLENLAYAADRAGEVGIVIEPLNAHDVLGYFYSTTSEGVSVLEALNRNNVGLMFDAYHLKRMGEDLIERFDLCEAWIKHVQFAGIEGRHEPASGEFKAFFEHIVAKGFDAPVGAEYKPRTTVEAGLDWRASH